MIRIKTLRRLIFLAEHIVNTYHSTGRSEYLSFDEHLELLDVESISKALNISERTAYDYVAAIRELYRTFKSNDMTDPVECEDVTEVKDKAMHTWLKYYVLDDKEPCCDDKTEVKEVDPAELRNKILEAFKAQGFEIAPDEAEIL